MITKKSDNLDLVVLAVKDTTYASLKTFRLTGIRILTSAMLVQCSTNWASMQTGSRSLNWFVIYPGKKKEEFHILELQNEEK